MEPDRYAAQLSYRDTVPSRKIVVDLLDNGQYLGRFGEIANPVDGDYSTGRINEDTIRTLDCDPKPAHAKWVYYEDKLSEDQRDVPKFHCLQVFGQWWVVDVDREGGLAQQVAALEYTDNPNHNQGIHNRGSSVYESVSGSEFSKVLDENLNVRRP